MLIPTEDPFGAKQKRGAEPASAHAFSPPRREHINLHALFFNRAITLIGILAWGGTHRMLILRRMLKSKPAPPGTHRMLRERMTIF